MTSHQHHDVTAHTQHPLAMHCPPPPPLTVQGPGPCGGGAASPAGCGRCRWCAGGSGRRRWAARPRRWRWGGTGCPPPPPTATAPGRRPDPRTPPAGERGAGGGGSAWHRGPPSFYRAPHPVTVPPLTAVLHAGTNMPRTKAPSSGPLITPMTVKEPWGGDTGTELGVAPQPSRALRPPAVRGGFVCGRAEPVGWGGEGWGRGGSVPGRI